MDLVRVTPRLHMLRFPIGQAYMWSDGGELTLVDAGHADAAPLMEQALTDAGLHLARLRRIVLTHCHRDHVGAPVSWPGGTAPRCWRTAWTPR
jgi:glyoxylase-like metal-dependent hydrolase (beta-lactamase superfamily II)